MTKSVLLMNTIGSGLYWYHYRVNNNKIFFFGFGLGNVIEIIERMQGILITEEDFVWRVQFHFFM